MATKTKQLYGYRVKIGVNPEAAMRAIGFPYTSISGMFGRNSPFYNKAIEAGVLDLLFEGVYEPEKKKMKIRYEKKGQTLEVEIDSDGKFAYFESGAIKARFSRASLMCALADREANEVKFRPTYFDIGCTGQYHNVSAEDIRKVIDQMN